MEFRIWWLLNRIKYDMMEKKGKHNDDVIRDLMQKEGLLHTTPNFTEKVMDQVGQIKTYGLNGYKPLIGIRGWVIISLCVMMLVACCILVLSIGSVTSAGYFDFLEPVFAYFRNLDFNVNINFGTVLIGSMVFLSIMVLLSVDFVFSTKISLE